MRRLHGRTLVCVAILKIDIILNRLINGMYHMPSFVLSVLLVAAAKIHFEEQVPVAGTKQNRQSGKAGSLTRQSDQQDSWAGQLYFFPLPGEY
jgi:hypothetical protein